MASQIGGFPTSVWERAIDAAEEGATKTIETLDKIQKYQQTRDINQELRAEIEDRKRRQAQGGGDDITKTRKEAIADGTTGSGGGEGGGGGGGGGGSGGYWTPEGLKALQPTEGRYDQIHYPTGYTKNGVKSSASGAFGFIDETWREFAGPDIAAKYPRAYMAPPEIQDQVALRTPISHWIGRDKNGVPFNAKAVQLAANPRFITGGSSAAPASSGTSGAPAAPGAPAAAPSAAPAELPPEFDLPPSQANTLPFAPTPAAALTPTPAPLTPGRPDPSTTMAAPAAAPAQPSWVPAGARNGVSGVLRNAPSAPAAPGPGAALGGPPPEMREQALAQLAQRQANPQGTQSPINDLIARHGGFYIPPQQGAISPSRGGNDLYSGLA